MIKRFFGGIWRAITVVRQALANLLFLLLLVALLLIIVPVLSNKQVPLPERAALVLNPAGRVVDERGNVDAAELFLEADIAQGETLLTDLIDSVTFATDDPRIVALVMELDELLSIGQSRSAELAVALSRFRATGKPVVAIGDYYTQDQYRLAVEADTLLMHPFGAVALEGLAYYTNYYASALEKLSVNMHVFRAGEFKSVAEPLLRDDMSAGERSIAAAWLGDLWAAYTAAVEERRALPPGSLQTLLDNYPQRLRGQGGNAGRLAQSGGLIDELLDRNQQNEYLSELVGAQDDDGKYASVSFREYLPRMQPISQNAYLPNVAVVTAVGNMLPGVQPPGTIGGDSLARLLRDTAGREGTDAIVLRIDSGGGSVFASEIIRAELARIRDAGTPVVVSMGRVAASGGYYIATAADRIIATPTTLTGSIGVFAAFPTLERLLERGGVSTDGVGTTRLAGGLRLDRALAPEIEDVLQQSVDDIYEQFVSLVMESRQMDRASVDRVAQGRVLSGQAALGVGLVDALGGLDDAIKQAAELAGLSEDNYEVLSIQPAMSARQMFLQQLNDRMGGTFGVDSLLSELLAPSGMSPAMHRWLEPARQGIELLQGFADPKHVYMRCLACEL